MLIELDWEQGQEEVKEKLISIFSQVKMKFPKIVSLIKIVISLIETGEVKPEKIKESHNDLDTPKKMRIQMPK